MAKTKQDVQAPRKLGKAQDDAMDPFKGGTRMGKGQTDPSKKKIGAAGRAQSGKRIR